MLSAHHDLTSELPDHKDTIHALKVSDTRFRKLLEEYNDLDTDVHSMEQAGQPISDAAAEGMKKRRLQLKDELYKMITAHEGATA